MNKNILNKKRKLKIRNQTSVRGITLVALVITVIILLILAGVAISMITGGDGLFSRAENAATKYNEAAQNEAYILNALIKEYLGDEDTWIDSKIEYYDFDATATAIWLEFVKDETLYEGTRIKYYFSKSNDNTTWTEYSEDITANGDSRYIKVKIVYQKENNEVQQDAVVNDFYIRYKIGDTENSGQYIEKTLHKYEKDLTIDFVNGNVNYTVTEGAMGIDGTYGIYPTGYGTGSGWLYATAHIDYDKPIYLPTNFEISADTRYQPPSVTPMAAPYWYFQKKQEDGSYLTVFEFHWFEAYEVEWSIHARGYFNGATVGAVERIPWYSHADRIGITGDLTQYVFYFCGKRGSLARPDLFQISFDRIEFKFGMYSAYPAGTPYTKDIYIGEPKHITQ